MPQLPLKEKKSGTEIRRGRITEKAKKKKLARRTGILEREGNVGSGKKRSKSAANCRELEQDIQKEDVLNAELGSIRSQNADAEITKDILQSTVNLSKTSWRIC